MSYLVVQNKMWWSQTGLFTDWHALACLWNISISLYQIMILNWSASLDMLIVMCVDAVVWYMIFALYELCCAKKWARSKAWHASQHYWLKAANCQFWDKGSRTPIVTMLERRWNRWWDSKIPLWAYQQGNLEVEPSITELRTSQDDKTMLETLSTVPQTGRLK